MFVEELMGRQLPLLCVCMVFQLVTNWLPKWHTTHSTHTHTHGCNVKYPAANNLRAEVRLSVYSTLMKVPLWLLFRAQDILLKRENSIIGWWFPRLVFFVSAMCICGRENATKFKRFCIYLPYCTRSRNSPKRNRLYIQQC